VGYYGLGATSYKTVSYQNWVDMFAAQKNEARRIWGETSVFMPGRTDVRYPNLTGTQWLKLKGYWAGPIDSVNSRVRSDSIAQGIIVSPLLLQDPATRTAWMREYDAYKSEVGFINTTLATAYGGSILPETISVNFWARIEPLILRSGGIFSSPRPYEILWEETVKQAQAVTSAIVQAPFKLALGAIPTWVKWGAVAAGGLYALSFLKGRNR
jgi:hypothetical protein